MKTLVLPALIACLALSAGCGRNDDAAAPAPATSVATDAAPVPSDGDSRRPPHPPGVTPKPEATTRVTAVRHPQNPKAIRDAPPFQRTGVAACDTYADVVLDCINKYTYAGSRAEVRKTFAKAVRGWQQSLDAGTPSSTVAQQCSAFRASFADKLQAVGCPNN